MKARDYTGWILLAGGIGFGIAAYFLTQRYLEAQKQKAEAAVLEAQGPVARVVVATRDLEPGTLVGKQSMSVGEIPRRHLSTRAVLPDEFVYVENRVLSRPMSAGEPLLEDFVSGLRAERFSDLLEPGTRALSLEVSALENHAGLLLPGDHIDLFVLLPLGNSGRDRKLVGLIEHVKVLAAGQQPLLASDQPYQPLDEQGTGYSIITVGLPWADAARTLKARRDGEIVYLLRPAKDDQLRFDLQSLPRFGESDAPAGYAYYSAAVPRGERRMAAGTPSGESQEVKAEFSLPDEEPLPLDVLFHEVPKPNARLPAADVQERG